MGDARTSFKVVLNLSLTPPLAAPSGGGLVFELLLSDLLQHPGAGRYGFSRGCWEVGVLALQDLDRAEKLGPPDPQSAAGASLSVFSRQLQGGAGDLPLVTLSRRRFQDTDAATWRESFFPLREGLDENLAFRLADAGGRNLVVPAGWRRSSLLLTVCLRRRAPAADSPAARRRRADHDRDGQW